MATERSVIFLDKNVYQAAKDRMRWLLINYDEVWVSFSGGKDSLCVLHLLRETMDDMGMQSLRTKAFFRDEEVIPDDVIRFVQGYCEDPDLTARFDVRYFACPMASHIFMLGEHWPYVQWDEARRGNWMREKPPYAITSIHPDNVPLDQHVMNGLTFKTLGVKGKIAVVNGIRADESLTRFRSSLRKKGEFNWVLGASGNDKNIHFVRPIFDWGTADLFKYFKQRGVTYPSIYDMQMYSGETLRVATPLHDRAYMSLVKLRETYPTFYEQILSIWPEVATHERYYKAVDAFQVIEDYPHTWQGILQYIEEKIESAHNRELATKLVGQCRRMRETNRRLGKYSDSPCYGFPILYVFQTIVSGKYSKGITAKMAVGVSDLIYEGLASGDENDSHTLQPVATTE